ncbi:MAG: M20 family metallo-hydrolase [Prevotella sp.]|nr:M20 family metallo-hydrolase [Prevotella sp.]
MDKNKYLEESVALLRRLIAIHRVSREEREAADLIERQMAEWRLEPRREGNNVWAMCPGFDAGRPTLLLNAHIDTVKAVSSWTRPPLEPTIEGDRLYGLGSNDCGGGLVTLLAAFRMLVDEGPAAHASRAYNIIYVASCEEEVSGRDGIARVLPLLPPVSVAIVGEPTGMQPAVAEKGLMVIDGWAQGVSGHAARNEGVNAIYEALDDLVWLRDYRFERVSPLLGPTKMTVTVVESGTQHNVVPDKLHFVLDVRTNEYYRNEDVHSFLQQHMKKCRLDARSYRLHSSAIPMEHPLVKQCLALGLQPFGSPTLSDQALMDFPSLKLGPGQSSRSHSADEFICLSEMRQALDIYLKLLF